MSEEKKGFFRGLLNRFAGEEPSVPERAPDSADEMPQLPVAGAGAGDQPQDKPARPGFFERLKQGLARTHESLVGRIDTLLLGKKEIDADTLEELEEIL